MHIIIGFLTALVTIFYLLDRLGIDLGGFNPFHWRRRRAWANKYNSDPIYSVEDPMHVAALLVLGAAKLDGVISAEQKRVALEQFAITFSLDARDASADGGLDAAQTELIEKMRTHFVPPERSEGTWS